MTFGSQFGDDASWQSIFMRLFFYKMSDSSLTGNAHSFFLWISQKLINIFQYDLWNIENLNCLRHNVILLIKLQAHIKNSLTKIGCTDSNKIDFYYWFWTPDPRGESRIASIVRTLRNSVARSPHVGICCEKLEVSQSEGCGNREEGARRGREHRSYQPKNSGIIDEVGEWE